MAKKEAPAKGITAYNMKLKKSEVITDVKIKKTETGKFFAKGVGSDGTVCCVAMGEAKATAAIKDGLAKKEGKW